MAGADDSRLEQLQAEVERIKSTLACAAGILRALQAKANYIEDDPFLYDCLSAFGAIAALYEHLHDGDVNEDGDE